MIHQNWKFKSNLKSIYEAVICQENQLKYELDL